MKEILVDLNQEVAIVCKMVVDGLEKHSDSRFDPGVLTGFTEELLKFDNVVIKESLGEFGVTLRDFLDRADFNQPGLSNIFLPLINSQLATQMIDALRVTDFANQIGATALLKLIRTVFNDKKLVKDIMANLLTKPPIRFLKDRSERDYVREHGVYQHRLHTIVGNIKKSPPSYNDVKLVTNNEVFWFEQPSTFKLYVRCNDYYITEIQRLQKIQEYMKQCSLISLGNAFGSRSSSVRKLTNETYYGFHRIGATNAATILAKVHSFRIDANCERIIIPIETCKELATVISMLIVPNGLLLAYLRSFFAVSSIHTDESNATESLYEVLHKVAVNEFGKPATMDADGVVVRYLKKIYPRFWFSYQPRMYRLLALKEYVPEHIWKIIDGLECFTEISGGTLFDNYYLIVPGINIEKNYFYHASKGKFYMRNGGDMQDFETIDKANEFLDTRLIECKLINPIVIGQRDDKYYFISYLNNSENE